MAAENIIRPVATADVRSRFIKILRSNAEAAKAVADALRNKKQSKQHAVDKNGWDGDIFNSPDIKKPWDTKEHEEDVINSIKDLNSPGVVGDLIVSVLQGDWLATQERAFRARHSTKVRNTMHAAARRAGHGHEAGLFNKGVLNYVKHVVKLSKDARK